MADTAACRILVLASTLERARDFVQRVKALAGTHDAAPATHADDAGSASIPWTIANRYYTAEVHFETRALGAFAGHHASDVPAVVYVWQRGEAYREQVPAVAGKLRAHDPEVALAVRFGAPAEDEEGVDEFLAEHGFEYVDGERGGRRPTGDGASADDEDSADVPGLPRVVDALSTIMWPSLVQSEGTRTRRSRARELLDLARDEEADDGLRALLPSSSSATTTTQSRMQREMAELERWLEADVRGDDAQAWAAPDGPTAAHTAGVPAIHAFDDDFAEFVGAPVEVEYGYAALRQEPMHTGASWHTLASELADEDALDGAGDPDLPSRAEIADTARRLFAGAGSLDVPAPPPRARRGSAPAPPPTATAHTELEGEDVEEGWSGFGASEDEDEYETRAFDLSRVFGALQGMKEEIAGIADEDERRKAAARVALGLVYGLQREHDDAEEF